MFLNSYIVVFLTIEITSFKGYNVHPDSMFKPTSSMEFKT